MKHFTIIALAAAITACGGGSGSGSDTAATGPAPGGNNTENTTDNSSDNSNGSQSSDGNSPDRPETAPDDNTDFQAFAGMYEMTLPFDTDDEIYAFIEPNGEWTEYDYDGDASGEGMNCYYELYDQMIDKEDGTYTFLLTESFREEYEAEFGREATAQNYPAYYVMEFSETGFSYTPFNENDEQLNNPTILTESDLLPSDFQPTCADN